MLLAQLTAATLFRPSIAGLWLAALLLAGCKVFDPASAVTPQITGQVLAADTRQPLAGVKVIRVMPGQGSAPLHGAELMQQSLPENTDAAGRFSVAGSDYFTFFHRTSWGAVRLSFQASGYYPLTTNFTALSFTNQTATGEPVVDVGEVLLKSRIK
ncbi:MAG: hypothetical protein WCK57_02550 [Verrucomicrobiae bacterium]